MASTKKKFLMVGCGGIGCELLKHLCSSENSITILDFDTIDPTNLNRQFLFTKKDINKFKSEVAASKYKSLGYDVNFLIKNVLDCNLEFFKSFDTIFNCLDNNESRSFVNLMCKFSKKPFIDGGSGGWLGQSLYFESDTECFACVPRGNANNLTQVCSIHGIPTKFMHCLVWAKEFLNTKISEKKFLKKLKKEMKNNIKFQENRISNLSDAKIKNEENLHINFEVKKLKTVNEGTEYLNCNKVSNDLKEKDEHIEKPLPLIKNEQKLEGSVIIPSIDQKIDLVKFLHLKKKFTTKKIAKFIKFKENSNGFYKSNFNTKTKKKYIKIIYRLAKLKSKIYFIKPNTFIDSETLINSIVPSICTTNSIVSSLMMLSFNLHKNFYISKKQILGFDLNLPNDNCSICNSKKMIFSHKKCTFNEFIVFFQDRKGKIESIYTNNELLFDNILLKKNTEEFNLENNLFFYVKSKEIYLVYNCLREGELLLEEVC